MYYTHTQHKTKTSLTIVAANIQQDHMKRNEPRSNQEAGNKGEK